MSKRISLREFQQALSQRIQDSAAQSTAGSRLAVRVGEVNWLIDLADISEVIAPPPCTSVPLTQSWFMGVTNIRGRLFSVIDLPAYAGMSLTQPHANNRLLLTHPRFGAHAALLVNQALGLRNIERMQHDTSNIGNRWQSECYRDANGDLWHSVKLETLINKPEFMHITR